MAERWSCGAYGCRAVVTGEQGKMEHLEQAHPHLFGLLYILYEGPDPVPGSDNEKETA